MTEDNEKQNYITFRDCLSTVVIEKLAVQPSRSKAKRTKGRKNEIKALLTSVGNEDEQAGNDAEDLAEFSEYLATEIFDSFPADLRNISYGIQQTCPSAATAFSIPLSASTVESIVSSLSPAAIDSLTTYSLLPSSASSLSEFLSPILTDYIASCTSTPALSRADPRPAACEICERDWIPLTYHHLIPRQVHAKAIKRGWHEEWRLNSVAWLCRACHSFVHRIAGNEELAREWWSVERLLAREDVQAWRVWVGRVRWKSR